MRGSQASQDGGYHNWGLTFTACAIVGMFTYLTFSCDEAAYPAGVSAITLLGPKAGPGAVHVGGGGSSEAAHAGSSHTSGGGGASEVAPAHVPAEAAPAAPAAPAHRAPAVDGLHVLTNTGFRRLNDSEAESAPPPQYLVGMQVLEGFGAYPDGLVELFYMAKALNRWLVEPCIRNACVEPCRCGEVLDGPDVLVPFDQARVDAGEDPLGLPALPARCKQFRHYMAHGFTNDPEPSYPMRALFDLEYMAGVSGWPYVISYNQWCSAYNSTSGKGPAAGRAEPGAPPAMHPTLPRWREAKAYNFDFQQEAQLNNLPIGDFSFDTTVWGRVQPQPDEGLKLMSADTSTNIFLHNFYRSYMKPWYELVTPRLNQWHVAVTQRWIKERFGGKPYAVFHWRHEFADPDKLAWCADTLVNQAHAFTQLKPESSQVAMIVDMPPPGQTVQFWVDNYADPAGIRTKIVKRLLEEGFRIYDAEHAGVDSGILALRDYLVGVEADAYVTRVGSHPPQDDLSKCFKPGSNYISRIETDRRRAGRGDAFEKWQELRDHPEVYTLPETHTSVIARLHGVAHPARRLGVEATNSSSSSCGATSDACAAAAAAIPGARDLALSIEPCLCLEVD